MKPIDVVAAVIIIDGKYFCVKRGLGRIANKWEFPGGKVESFETHQEALIREIKEELNSLIEVKEFLISSSYQYDTISITLHAYQCELIAGELELTEHIEKKWVEKNQLKALDWAEADIPIVEWIVNN